MYVWWYVWEHFLLTTITDIDFASEVGGSENLFRVARLILAGYGFANDLPPFYIRYTGCRLNHRQTKRHDRPAYIRQFYVQWFLQGSTRSQYVKSALIALLRQTFHFYKFRITFYSFNGFVDADERREEILTQHIKQSYKKMNVAHVIVAFYRELFFII